LGVRGGGRGGRGEGQRPWVANGDAPARRKRTAEQQATIDKLTKANQGRE
jgi:hypothetical protein